MTMPMKPLAAGLDYTDLNFLGTPGIIATAVIHGSSGVSLIDPGPTTCLERLRENLLQKGIRISDVRHLLLTHIHLDHAGSTGSLVRENPGLEVFVHERGAPHLSDPTKLLASASRLYGDDMARLWGDFLAVPADRIRVLQGGERLVVSGRTLEVAYTPGHAWHHVSYFDADTRIAFVGDVAGIRRETGAYILPPTQPPDIDLESWRASEARILEWEPETLFLTHFGPHHGARVHFQELFARLDDWNAITRRLLSDSSLSDEEREKQFVEAAFQDLRRTVGEAEAARYSRAGRLDFSWQGLARYWRKKAA
jgi:glyoxylase-like metal-dependent hydrolase (beta-lactamase superfamily II)